MRTNWRLLNLWWFLWYSPLLTSEQVTLNNMKISQRQVLDSVKRKRRMETNSNADTPQRYQPCANLSHLSKTLTRTKALYYGFRGPPMSFLVMIYLPNNHSVAVWHSSCKRVFISLEPDDRKWKNRKAHMVDDKSSKTTILFYISAFISLRNLQS